GRSLADDRGQTLGPAQCKLSLAGLGVALRELRHSTRRTSFATAQAACGRLGLMLPALDPTARSYFERYTESAPPRADRPASIQADLEALRASVIEAAYEADPANDPPFFERLIGDPEPYRFEMLGNALRGGGGPVGPKSRQSRPSSAR